MYGRERFDEFEAFFAWLHKTIVAQNVDVLLVAGDVFDSVYPSHQSQSMYIKFLGTLSTTPCKHVVITAGNHDSAGLIDMHQPLFDGHHLNIHVVGRPSVDREVIVVEVRNEKAVVCAIPYLREEDIRVSSYGDSSEQRSEALHRGVEQHYADVLKQASEICTTNETPALQIVMGHLFTAGKEREASVELESGVVRDLYVGGTPYVQPGVFGEDTDYVALGHLHVPQTVNQQEHMRYSGSPLPMSFSEAGQQKSVVLVETKAGQVSDIATLEIPSFRTLKRVSGDTDDILTQLQKFITTSQSDETWVEVEYSGKGTDGNLRQRIEALVNATNIHVLSIRNMFVANTSMYLSDDIETLDELTPAEIFSRRLQEALEDPEHAERLTALFEEVTHAVTSRQNE